MRRFLWAIGLALGVAAAGCRAPRPDLTPTTLPGPALAEAARVVPTPDLSALPAILPVAASAPTPAKYLSLSAEECRRSACAHAALARAGASLVL